MIARANLRKDRRLYGKTFGCLAIAERQDDRRNKGPDGHEEE
jgi:hypothetical protein